MQSRDNQGAILDNLIDNYEIKFSGPDGGFSGEFYLTSVYQELGLYLAQFVPQVSGQYTVTVKLSGIEISGSPFSAIVYPGEVKSSICTSTVTS